MYILSGIIVLILGVILFEYRIRKPDHIALYESKGQVRRRHTRFYPRHFSLTIPGTIHSSAPEIEVETKGRIRVLVRLTITVVPSLNHLPALIRMGGWNKDAVIYATKELEVLVNALVREYAEKFNIEELSAEGLSNYIKKSLTEAEEKLGLEIISANIHSIEALDEKIAEAIQQKESARILEQTEIANQNTRVGTAKVETEANEQIALYEHTLELKKYDLKKVEEEREAELARRRIEEEVNLKKMQLEIEKKEIEILINNPELLILTPQVARLAEASQSLRNARTVVSLASKDMNEGSEFISLLKTLLQNMAKSFELNESPPKKQVD